MGWGLSLELAEEQSIQYREQEKVRWEGCWKGAGQDLRQISPAS